MAKEKRLSVRGKAKRKKDPLGFAVVRVGTWTLMSAVMLIPFVVIHAILSVRDVAHWIQDRRDKRRKVAKRD